MALTQVTAGNRIVTTDVNQFYNILKGVSGSGETITLIYNNESLIFQPSSDPAAGTRAWTVKNNAGTVLASMRYDGLLKLLATTAEPASPVTGSIFYDTDDTSLKVYDGAAWQSVKFGRTNNVWAGPEAFTLSVGTPVLAAQGTNVRYRAWAMDAAGTEAMNGEVLIPEDFSTGNLTIKMHWTNLGAGSGNVYWRVTMKGIADAADLNSTASETNVQDAVIAAPAQDILKISTLATATLAGAASRYYWIKVIRLGGDAGDTLANDAGFIGIEFEYTALL